MTEMRNQALVLTTSVDGQAPGFEGQLARSVFRPRVTGSHISVLRNDGSSSLGDRTSPSSVI